MASSPCRVHGVGVDAPAHLIRIAGAAHVAVVGPPEAAIGVAAQTALAILDPGELEAQSSTGRGATLRRILRTACQVPVQVNGLFGSPKQPSRRGGVAVAEACPIGPGRTVALDLHHDKTEVGLPRPLEALAEPGSQRRWHDRRCPLRRRRRRHGRELGATTAGRTAKTSRLTQACDMRSSLFTRPPEKPIGPAHAGRLSEWLPGVRVPLRKNRRRRFWYRLVTLWFASLRFHRRCMRIFSARTSH